MNADFIFHTDAAHGWLEVTAIDLGRLLFSLEDFSRYSYRRGNTFFLEEDCDAGKFLVRWEAKHNRKPVFGERFAHRSFIRDLPRIK